MNSGRKTKLAASFVVTVSALTGCKKETVETPDPSRVESAYVARNGDRCTMGAPEHCPKGASCNPPPPAEIDCPPTHRDAGEPVPSSARPPGKEDWLRVKPHFWASQYGCSYSADYFCAPPPKAFQCTPVYEAPPLKCHGIVRDDLRPDAAPATRWKVEAFVYKDGLGVCHRAPEFDCSKSDCIADMPAGEPTACP